MLHHSMHARIAGSIALLALATLSLAASGAQAQPNFPGSVALRWDSCYGDGGADSRSFACDTNAGSEVLVVSAFPPDAIPQLSGAEVWMTVLTTGEPVSSWWDLTSFSGCRSTALGFRFVAPAGASQCHDFWAGSAAGGVNFTLGDYWPDAFPGAEISFVAAIPGSVAVPAGVEVFIGSISINHAKTLGAGSCGGCSSGLCLGLTQVILTQPTGLGDLVMHYALPGTNSDVVGWQMNGVAMPYATTGTPHGYVKYFSGCLSATDAARPTWGAIKRMYR